MAAEITTHKDGVLTLNGMMQVIKDGGSVQLSDGRVITKAEDLPKASELAKDDPKAAKDELAKLNAEMRVQAAEIARLKNIAEGKNADGSAKNPPADDPPT